MLSHQVVFVFGESPKLPVSQETNSLIVKYKQTETDKYIIHTLEKQNGITSTKHLFSNDSHIPAANTYSVLTSDRKIPLKFIIRNYRKSKVIDWIIPDTYIYSQNLKNGGFDIAAISPTMIPTQAPTKTVTLTPTKNPTKIPTKIIPPTPTNTPSPIVKKNAVGIAVLDSGIVPAAVNSKVISHSSLPIIDELGHGTYITQIIQNRVPEASQIIPFKVIGKEGYGKLSDVLRTLQYISDHPDLNIRIINMSFASERIAYDTDICKAYAIFNPNKSNILYISAAGNDNQGIIPDKDYPGIAPASCDGFMAVGSIKIDKTKTADSNYGKTVFASTDSVKAQKLSIDKSICKTTVCSLQGTSIATALLTSELANKLVTSPTINKIQLISSLAKLPFPQASTLAKKTTQFAPIPSIKIPTPTRNIGGTEIITKEKTVEKVVKETNTKVVIVTPTPTRSQFVNPTSKPMPTTTPAPTSKPSITNAPIPSAPAPTSTPGPVSTATPLPQPTPTSQPAPTEIRVCRDECIDYRDECPAGTADAGSCPTSPGFKLCSCTR
jgi:hypothetical protein